MPAPLPGYDDVTITVTINAALDRLLLACATLLVDDHL